MDYANHDFIETLKRAKSELPCKPLRVLNAWGEKGDYAEWEGGFVLWLEDNTYAYMEGWCDTTGWGCQDGVSVRLGKTIKSLKLPLFHGYNKRPCPWEGSPPADINKWIDEGFKDPYESRGIYDE
jgi:hypothetical protein